MTKSKVRVVVEGSSGEVVEGEGRAAEMAANLVRSFIDDEIRRTTRLPTTRSRTLLIRALKRLKFPTHPPRLTLPCDGAKELGDGGHAWVVMGSFARCSNCGMTVEVEGVVTWTRRPKEEGFAVREDPWT
jgi:hypothetical protein